MAELPGNEVQRRSREGHRWQQPGEKQSASEWCSEVEESPGMLSEERIATGITDDEGPVKTTEAASSGFHAIERGRSGKEGTGGVGGA